MPRSGTLKYLNMLCCDMKYTVLVGSDMEMDTFELSKLWNKPEKKLLQIYFCGGMCPPRNKDIIKRVII